MAITGDFGKLRELIAACEKLGPKTMEMLGKNFAAEATSLVMLGFSQSKSPDGASWAGLKLRNGKPLLDTGAHLRGSFSATGTATTLELGFGFAYASVHQYGATIRAKKSFLRIPYGGSRGGRGKGVGYLFAKKVTIPARPMLPEPGHMPALWGAAFEDVARETIAHVAGRLVAAE